MNHKLTQKRKWTQNEIDLLVKDSRKATLEELSKTLNRSKSSVKSKITKLGLSRNVYKTEGLKCLMCGKEFSDYKKRKRKFCSRSCSASYTNKLKSRTAKSGVKCKNCGKETKNKAFCCHRCCTDYHSVNSYRAFLKGVMSKNITYSPKSFKKYFLQEQHNKCSICGIEPLWNSARLEFILDHIDGNSQNNARSNLRLVCPNCDSQLETFKSRNRGSGRFYRRNRYAQGKSY